MLNLLLVEDDLDLATAIVDYLDLESVSCDHASNGLQAVNLINNNRYNTIILDLNLPQMDGLSVCRTVRTQGVDTPILMLTARDSLDDKLTGFAAGADDYLIKPFALEELLVRVKVLSQRRSGQVQKLFVADLVLDLPNKVAYRQSQQLKLSPITWKIAEVLARASPQAVSRADLLQAVWGDEQPDSNSLKVHIHNLRKQLDKEGLPTLLQTVAGFGFVLKESE